MPPSDCFTVHCHPHHPDILLSQDRKHERRTDDAQSILGDGQILVAVPTNRRPSMVCP